MDKWQWYLELVKGCTVSDVYQLLTNVEPHVASTFSDIIWHKEVPLKVSLFVRRLLSNWILTKNNLFRWGILHQNTHLCKFGCSLVESAKYLFLVCLYIGSIQHLLRQWLGISGVDPLCVSITFFSSVKWVRIQNLSDLLYIWFGFHVFEWFGNKWRIWFLTIMEELLQQLLDRIKLVSFYPDPWVGGIPFSVRYTLLFE